jgi:hypothetical protein
MKKFTFLIALYLLISVHAIFAQKVVITGINHLTPDGFSFVARENLPIGEVVYFTENEYNNAGNAFLDQTECVVKFTVTSSINAGNVVYVEETGVSTNVFTVASSSGAGTAVKTAGSGDFAIATNGDGFYAYTDNDENPVNGVTEIYSVLYTGSGEAPTQNGGLIPANENPVSDFPNAVVVHGFPNDGDVNVGLNRVEYNPALRNVDVGSVDFTIIGNWLHSQPNADLSITPFVGVAEPGVSVTVSPSSVLEDGATNLVYTFTLSATATSNVTVNFSVGGAAVFSTDYTQTGAATFGTTSGTVVIANGSSSASVTISPSIDTNLETNETVVLTVNSGTGYVVGSPINATGTITNDDVNSTAALVALTGINHVDPDGFSFAALENLSDGTTIYFTENSFDNSTFTFTGDEAVLKWTASGSVVKGEVIFIKEISANTFSVICGGGSGCGTITRIGGDFALSTTGETIYAYGDVDDNHKNGITAIYSALYTGNSAIPGGNIPVAENPTTFYTNSILIDGFPAVEPNRTEYDPLKRVVDVSNANFSNLNNWLHAQSNVDLSTVPFVESIDPSVAVSISPSDVLEDGATNMEYTFTLSEVAASDYTINFTVGGTATLTADYTQTGAATFGASSGTVVIPNGSTSASVTVIPVSDSDLEADETIILTVSPGTGYVSGSPSSQTGTITNDDTNNNYPMVAITGLNHLDNDGFSFVTVNDIPASTKIYFTDNSFNINTLTFGSGESVVSWTSPAGIVPAGQVIVVTETGSDVLSLARSGGADPGSITLESGNFAIATDGETFYAYNVDDNDPTNGIIDIYAVLFTGADGVSGGTIPSLDNPSGVYLNALVVDGFPATNPNRTEYKFASGERGILVENVDFKNVNNWLHAAANQTLSAIPFTDLKIVAGPELTTDEVVIFTSTQALMGGNITNGGSNLVTERGVVYSMVDNTPTIGEVDVIKETNGTGTGIFSELIESLIPNTTYYVQAYAINSAGTGYGGVESFTTSFGIAIWNGSTDGDWFTSANWDIGVVPDARFNAFIPGGLSNYPTITAATVCNNLFMESTSVSTGSLLGQENLTVNGISVIERFMSGNKWHMVASPVPGQSIELFLTTNSNIPTKNTDDRGMMDYNEASNNWNAFFTSTQPGNLTSGKGFSLRNDADDVVVFAGELGKGTILPSVTTNGFGWNCIGNPYPSAIFMNDAADPNNNFIDININEFDPSYAAVYVWEQDNNAYTIVNLGDPAFYAQLAQGFFVKAKTGVTQMQFTTDMQTHQPEAAFKNGAVSIPEIKFIAKLEDNQSSTRIKFDDNMQTKLDIGYDAGIFKNGFDLYSQLVEDNGVDFGIQYLPSSALNNVEISLGLDSKYSGIVTFSSELVNIPIGYQVVLEDRLTNSFTRLSDGQVYTALLGQDTQGKGRFYIHISNSSTSILEDGLKQNYTFYSDKHKIYINGQVKGKTMATLYDLLGKKIYEVQLGQTPVNTISTSEIKTGIYLLNIKYQGGTFTQKIPVNK